MKAIFAASQFTPTQWNTAADKAKFANQFVRFVESGFKPTLFPKWFYQRLSMTFGHIAHYNQGGFFAEFFEDDQGKLRFLDQTVNASFAGVGDPAFTYSDVERVLKTWVIEQDLIAKYRAQIASANEAAERAELARLQAKYAGGAP